MSLITETTPVSHVLRAIKDAATPQCLDQLSHTELVALGRLLRAPVKYMPHNRAVQHVQFKLYTLILAVAEIMQQQGMDAKQPFHALIRPPIHGGQYEQRSCAICLEPITLLTSEQQSDLQQQLQNLPTQFRNQAEQDRTAARRQQLEEWLAGPSTMLPCTHNPNYHAACIANWIQAGNNTCPSCRAIIPGVQAPQAQQPPPMTREELEELARRMEQDDAEFGYGEDIDSWLERDEDDTAPLPRGRALSGEYDFQLPQQVLTAAVLHQYVTELGQYTEFTDLQRRAIQNLFQLIETEVIHLNPEFAIMMELSRLMEEAEGIRGGSRRCLPPLQLQSLVHILVRFLRSVSAR